MPVLYDIRKYQEELDLPKGALMQEVVTRWWSILAMLESLNANIDAIILALNKTHNDKLILTTHDQNHIAEIIVLLRQLTP